MQTTNLSETQRGRQTDREKEKGREREKERESERESAKHEYLSVFFDRGLDLGLVALTARQGRVL